jgi:16S rRNA (adenine1518-N6/adenine1519-N6)-dimethyltransferase
VRQKLGQHFLKDEGIIARILSTAEVSPDDRILEIGPGRGSLTCSLARQAKQFIAIEYDTTLVEYLQQRFAEQGHIRIIQADARYFNYEELLQFTDKSGIQRLKLIANLPYYAAVPIMLSIFRYSHVFSQCIFMFQKEVAERITATPGTKSYGSLSVAAQYYSKPSYCFSVPPRAFQPPPKVDSAVVSLKFFDHPCVDVLDQQHFFQLVKCAFLTRRKTLKNSLTKQKANFFPKELLLSAFEALHFHERIRGEELSIQDFANLSNLLIKMQRSS